MKPLAALVISATMLWAQNERAVVHSVTAIRSWSLTDVTRIAIEVSGDFHVRSDRLHNPERVYFDIVGARPHMDARRIWSKEIGDRLVQRVRVAETAPGTTRIVLDLAGTVEVSTSQLSNPNRLIVELRPGNGPPIPAEPALPVKPTPVITGDAKPAAPSSVPEADKPAARIPPQPVRSSSARPPGTPPTMPALLPSSPAMLPEPDSSAGTARALQAAKSSASKPAVPGKPAESAPLGQAREPDRTSARTQPTETARLSTSPPAPSNPKPLKLPPASVPAPAMLPPEPDASAARSKPSQPARSSVAKPVVASKPVEEAPPVVAVEADRSGKVSPAPATSSVAKPAPSAPKPMKLPPTPEPASPALPPEPEASTARTAPAKSGPAKPAPVEALSARPSDARPDTPLKSEPPVPSSSAAEFSQGARRTSTGGSSLTRALGLKIGRIVIDAGHGGHDQGTQGPHGLVEKDLVLDVALRVGKMIEERMNAEVIYTRSDDTFVPLEGRTAIANMKKADLFLSIHANSSPITRISGMETFYLNFTDSRDALDVASRENASSQKSVFELQDIIQKISLHEKLDESREFAGRVQAALFSFSSRNLPGLKNRGVKKAPFVVLIGANMPSVLAEIGFVSNPREEALLKKPDYRQKLAESLYRGVAKYAESLSHFQMAAN